MASIRNATSVAMLATALLGGGLASCGSSKSDSTTAGHSYPSDVTKPFKASCVTSAEASGAKAGFTKQQAVDYCNDSLACLEQHLSVDRFHTYVVNLQAGKTNPDATVVNNCIKEAVAKIKKK